jgi:hypothetical protein
MEQRHDCAVSIYIRRRQNLQLKFEASQIFVQGYVLYIPVKCSLQRISAEGKSDVDYDDDDDDDND